MMIYLYIVMTKINISIKPARDKRSPLENTRPSDLNEADLKIALKEAAYALTLYKLY